MVGISPVLVNTGDFLRNSERASIPSLVPRSSGPLKPFQDVLVLIVSWAFGNNMISVFQGRVVAGTCCWVWGEGEEGVPEVASIGMPGSALNDTSKHLVVVLEAFEVWCGVEGWFDFVGYCVSANFG